MRVRWLIFLLVLVGCTEDDFPVGIYGYQVERLLSGGDQKLWQQVVNTGNCQDSVRLFIRVASSTDSITVSRLNPNTACTGFDTLLLGNASASIVPEGILFTDSINFASGDTWIIQSITATTLTYVTGEGGFSYVSPEM